MPIIDSSRAVTTNAPRNARITMPMNTSERLPLRHLHGTLEQRRGKNHAGDAKPFQELRPDTGGLEGSDHVAVGADAFAHEGEDLVHADDVFFHAGDFGDADQLARSVAEARH